MLGQGVHPKIVQERLGPCSIGMTLNRYSHVTMDMQREAADRLDAALAACDLIVTSADRGGGCPSGGNNDGECRRRDSNPHGVAPNGF